MSLLVQFFGTHGSIPASFSILELQERLVQALRAANGRAFASEKEAQEFVRTELPFSINGTYGTNTACVAIHSRDAAAPLLCDAGSGLSVAGRRPRHFNEQHLLLSHLHWDHIQGLPFYQPLYDPNFHLTIHTCHKEAEAALRAQMAEPCFPLPLNQIPAKVTFKLHRDADVFEAGGFIVQTSRQCHPGDSYGFRITANGRTVVYATDAGRPHYDFCSHCKCPQFFKKADLLIYDAMLTREEELGSKASWGHSSNVAAVLFGALCEAHQLALIHHSPGNNDKQLNAIYAETLALAEDLRAKENWGAAVLKKIWMAHDGLEIQM